MEYDSKPGKFWHILYPVKETGELLELATTRPETMLGDTAVAVNPEDPRYALCSWKYPSGHDGSSWQNEAGHRWNTE